MVRKAKKKEKIKARIVYFMNGSSNKNPIFLLFQKIIKNREILPFGNEISIKMLRLEIISRLRTTKFSKFAT